MPKKYRNDQRERAVRMVMDPQEYPTPGQLPRRWARSWAWEPSRCASGSCRPRSTGVSGPGRRRGELAKTRRLRT